MSFRKSIARVTFLLALISLAWLILGILELAPLILHIPGETNLRAHASVTLLLLLLSSWAFWNEK
ncbi:hypothetical protein MCEMOH36_00491 [Candidatus Methylopumilus universalis]|jgi:small neutral amino acid transporter SnatA (MarC family)|uniref:hypothetical protein n=1 Tax=Candidatus Methylopumilus universalis TaxID=2588536 RepID=UPI003BEF13E4